MNQCQICLPLDTKVKTLKEQYEVINNELISINTKTQAIQTEIDTYQFSPDQQALEIKRLESEITQIPQEILALTKKIGDPPQSITNVLIQQQQQQQQEKELFDKVSKCKKDLDERRC